MLITSLTSPLRMTKQKQRTPTKILRQFRRRNHRQIKSLRFSHRYSLLYNPTTRHSLIITIFNNTMRINIQRLSHAQSRQLRKIFHHQSTHSTRHTLQNTVMNSNPASRLMLIKLTNRLRMLFNGFPHQLRHFAATQNRRSTIRVTKHRAHRAFNRFSHFKVNMKPSQRIHRNTNLLHNDLYRFLTPIPRLHNRRPKRPIRVLTPLIIPSMQPLATRSSQRILTITMRQVPNRIRPRIAPNRLNRQVDPKLNSRL